MAQRNFFIVVVCILLFNRVSYGQHKSVEIFPSFFANPSPYQYNTNFKSTNKFYQTPLRPVKNNSNYFIKTTSQSPIYSIAPNYYCKSLSFFCQQELKFEKATAIPLRFRLGSLAYTDYLEQKPNAIR